MNKQELNLIVKLITTMGKCLHEYGTSAHRLESILDDITKSLDIKGHFFSTPTYLAISLDITGEDAECEQRVHQIRVLPGDTNLYKLQLVDDIAVKIVSKKLSITQGIENLEQIQKLSSFYPIWVYVLTFPMTSLSLGVIFNADVREILISCFIGAIIGPLAAMAKKSQKLADSFEFVSSFLAMIIGTVIAHHIGGHNLQLVLIISLIIIIPGLDLTIAMNELATLHLASGTARLMGTIMIFFKMAFGILVASEITKQIYGAPIPSIVSTGNLPTWTGVIALILSCLCFTVLFQARPKDFKYILLSGLVTIGTLKLSGHYMGQILSIFISALSVGILSNINARILHKPAAVTLLPGIIFLVPGSIGLKGINLIFEHHFMAGLEGGFQAMIVSITIVAGLFLSNTIITPRKEL